MKRIFGIMLLMFCYISLSATKSCQEDYVLFKSYTTRTPTVTPTGTITEDYSDDDEDYTETYTATPTMTPTQEGEYTDISDEDETEVQEESVKSGVNMKELLSELEELSNENATSNWLGEAFINDSKEDSKDNEEEEDNEFFDSDGDGYSDVLELEMETNKDSDTSFPYILRTKLADRIDVKSLGNFNSNIDSDGDGLNDDLESALGINPYSKDTDNDGISDYREYINGTDPILPEF